MDQSISICRLHPGVAVTGFCPACLRDRLAGLNPPTAPASHPNSAAELRRCKSFSYYGRSAAAYMEPQRRSCDTRQEPQPQPPEGIQIGGMPMKEHISQESTKAGAGAFGSLGKKWQEWRRKSKLKKQQQAQASASNSRAPPPPEENYGSFRDTQSELAVARRSSCDVSCPKYYYPPPPAGVLDEPPRASWDGYHGGRPRLPPMLSVVEDANIVPRSDGQIPVEDDDDDDGDWGDAVPGSTAQTRDYYLDSSSSSRRRRSVDRKSFSGRKSFSSDAAVNGNDQLPCRMANACRVSPAVGAEFYHAQQQWQLPPTNYAMASGSCFEESAAAMAFRDGSSSKHKAKKWNNIWGFLNKKSSSNRAEPWAPEPEPELRAREQMLRCNSSVSARSSFSGIGNGNGRRSASTTVEMMHFGNGGAALGRTMSSRRDEVLISHLDFRNPARPTARSSNSSLPPAPRMTRRLY